MRILEGVNWQTSQADYNEPHSSATALSESNHTKLCLRFRKLNNVLLFTSDLYPSRPMRDIGRFPTMHMYFLLLMVGDEKEFINVFIIRIFFEQWQGSRDILLLFIKNVLSNFYR